MSTIGLSEMERLRSLKTPPYDVVVEAANCWMVQRGVSAAEFGRLIDKGRSTMNIFLRGDWQTHGTIVNPEYLTAQVWEFISENPAREPRERSERLLDTQGVKLIRNRFERALRGAVGLLYGPPSSEKSFVLEHLVAEREVAGHNDAIFVDCDFETSPLTMLRMIARELSLGTRSNSKLALSDAILVELRRRKKRVAIVIDEAQNMEFGTFQTVKRLADRSGSNLKGIPGCGVVMAGSHDLFEFLAGPTRAAKLEQNNSRTDFCDQLTGMTREEVLQIAARELGNGKPAKLSEDRQETILKRCTVNDRYARNEAGQKFARPYFSCRRLVKYLDQVRG